MDKILRTLKVLGDFKRTDPKKLTYFEEVTTIHLKKVLYKAYLDYLTSEEYNKDNAERIREAIEECTKGLDIKDYYSVI
jgi:hypothetical protein